jgi:hypothetical protein
MNFNPTAFFCLLLSIFSLQVHAESPILTVNYHGQSTHYTLSELNALPESSITTETPWTKTAATFSGVALKDLLRDLSIDSTQIQIKVIALNNYWSTIPYSEIEQYQPILALKNGGKTMSVRDKGPIWVIYPLSATSQLTNEVLHSRMVWQVATLEIDDQ